MMLSYFIKFFLPGVYTVYSRLNRKLDLLSWLFVFPGIVYLMNYLWFGEEIFTFTVIYLLYLFSWLSIYELGYLENDAITIKREKDPTLRIAPAEIKFIRENRWSIYLVRMILFVGLLYLLMGYIGGLGILAYSLVIAVSFLFFKGHNYYRDRRNIITYFGLACTKYIALTVSLTSPVVSPIYVGFWLLLFPLLRTIEHATKEKYRLVWLQEWVRKMDLFRVQYYIVLFSVSMVVYVVYWQTLPFKIFVLGVGLFLVFRLSAWLSVKYSIVERNRPSSYKWEENG